MRGGLGSGLFRVSGFRGMSGVGCIVIWDGLVWYGLVRYGVSWYDTVWYVYSMG